MSIGRIDRGRAEADKNFVVVRNRLFQITKLKVLDTVFAIHDSFHGVNWGCSVAIAVVARRPVADEQPGDENDQNYKETPFQYAFNFHVPNKACSFHR